MCTFTTPEKRLCLIVKYGPDLRSAGKNPPIFLMRVMNCILVLVLREIITTPHLRPRKASHTEPPNCPLALVQKLHILTFRSLRLEGSFPLSYNTILMFYRYLKFAAYCQCNFVFKVSSTHYALKYQIPLSRKLSYASP